MDRASLATELRRTADRVLINHNRETHSSESRFEEFTLNVPPRNRLNHGLGNDYQANQSSSSVHRILESSWNIIFDDNSDDHEMTCIIIYE
jgi:hypothetical protein